MNCIHFSERLKQTNLFCVSACPHTLSGCLHWGVRRHDTHQQVCTGASIDVTWILKVDVTSLLFMMMMMMTIYRA